MLEITLVISKEALARLTVNIFPRNQSHRLVNMLTTLRTSYNGFVPIGGTFSMIYDKNQIIILFPCFGKAVIFSFRCESNIWINIYTVNPHRIAIAIISPQPTLHTRGLHRFTVSLLISHRMLLFFSCKIDLSTWALLLNAFHLHTYQMALMMFSSTSAARCDASLPAISLLRIRTPSSMLTSIAAPVRLALVTSATSPSATAHFA